MELKYIVYITINLCNGKFYIGVHKTNPEIFDGYIGDGVYSLGNASRDYIFHRAVRKYGYKNFKRTTLKIFPNTEEGKKQAFALEAILVNETLLKSKFCYNTRLGGAGGHVVSSKKVYQYDLKGNLIKEWVSAADAKKITGINHICGVCNGSRSQAGGYYWSYDKSFKYTPGIDQSKKIAQYTKSGKFLRTWDSQKEAQRALGIYNINRAIKMGILCGGYQWKEFDGDVFDISPTKQMKYKDLLNSKIEQYFNNNLIKVWDNIETLHLNGFDRKYVRKVIKGDLLTYKGYSFKLKKDEDIVLTSNENLSSLTAE